MAVLNALPPTLKHGKRRTLMQALDCVRAPTCRLRFSAPLATLAWPVGRCTIRTGVPSMTPMGQITRDLALALDAQSDPRWVKWSVSFDGEMLGGFAVARRIIETDQTRPRPRRVVNTNVILLGLKESVSRETPVTMLPRTTAASRSPSPAASSYGESVCESQFPNQNPGITSTLCPSRLPAC
ncbi:hypothetical protein MKEN_00573900 [Mycena kentingensis (nom. inval.)]|nr:hypothetical protein MKEN_00573900 [Mycena kentingensis (nom. inval.)]